MPDPDTSPVPEPIQPQGMGHFRTEDDFELPPMPNGDFRDSETTEWSNSKSGSRRSIGALSTFGVLALVGALAVGGWLLAQGGSAEKKHPNWQRVAKATKASDADANPFVHVDGSGDSEVLPAIEVTRADADRGATREVRAALRRDDLVSATAALQAAQSLPSTSTSPDVEPPQIAPDSGLEKALGDRRQELYQIELFDCCHEDGDVVEVIVNGASFATVPLMHGGTKLSIPLERGANTVTIRSVKDGGGGVTLSFRTSRGDYFARSMYVGEEYLMSVVVQ